MSKINKLSVVCFLSFLFFFLFTFDNSFAKEIDDIDLTITYLDQKSALAKAKFSIYKIGDIEENNKIKLYPNFKNYPLELESTDLDLLNEYAESLEAYVKNDGLKEDFSLKTSSDGIAKCKIKRGLYLIIGENLKKNGYIYKTSPQIISLPVYDPESKSYLEKGEIYPKFIKEKISDKLISLNVLKIWDDEAYEDIRPKSIEINLLEDNKIIKSATLSKNNNWTYTFNNLKQNSSYNVIEKNIDRDKYMVKVKRDEDLITITNTIKGTNIPEDESGKIPFTGQSYTAIYLLTFLGITSIIIGFVKERGGENE